MMCPSCAWAHSDEQFGGVKTRHRAYVERERGRWRRSGPSSTVVKRGGSVTWQRLRAVGVEVSSTRRDPRFEVRAGFDPIRGGRARVGEGWRIPPMAGNRQALAVAPPQVGRDAGVPSGSIAEGKSLHGKSGRTSQSVSGVAGDPSRLLCPLKGLSTAATIRLRSRRERVAEGEESSAMGVRCLYFMVWHR